MFKRMVSLSIVLAVFVLVAQASNSTVSGVVMKLDPNGLQIQMGNHETKMVTLTSDTKYEKWIMVKPWQQSTSASFRSLEVGTKVRIDLQNDNPTTAKKVWIVIQ